MKGIFWNSRGLADLAKRRFLADASIEHKLDFITLSEYSDQTSNSPISVHQCHPWIGNADTHST